MKNKLYTTPFSKQYWLNAAKETRNIRKLTLCALLISLQIAVASNYILIGENLRLYGSFFIICLNSCLGGPIMALISGFVADTLGFLLFPSGNYFFGYAISGMMGAFIYALFTWKTKLSILKLALAKLTVNLFVNVFLGSLWTSMLYTKGFLFYVSASLIKNLLLFPIEVILLVLVFKTLVPFLYKKKLIICNQVPWF